MIKYLISAVMMSLAWSLRGQFGHLKGSMIPGAAAAAAILIFSSDKRWRVPSGLALLLGPLGFSAGGHMGYGRLIEKVLSAASLSSSLPELFQIFAIGAVWGGLGMSFLGFAFAENPFHRRDLGFLSGLGLIWLVVLGIFNLENYDLLFFAAGLAAIHVYNGFVKKSSTVSHFGVWGLVGFGGGFLFAVLILYLGNRGVFGSGWPWWSLRDQILGFAGGLGVWRAYRQAETSGLTPAPAPWDLRLQRAGLLFYAVLIPAIMTGNCLIHWRGGLAEPAVDLILWGISILSVIFFAILSLMFWRVPDDMFLGPKQRKVLVFSTLFFVWYLSLWGIAKETLPRGFGHWEAAYTFFLVDGLFLTLLLLET